MTIPFWITDVYVAYERRRVVSKKTLLTKRSITLKRCKTSSGWGALSTLPTKPSRGSLASEIVVFSGWRHASVLQPALVRIDFLDFVVGAFQTGPQMHPVHFKHHGLGILFWEVGALCVGRFGKCGRRFWAFFRVCVY